MSSEAITKPRDWFRGACLCLAMLAASGYLFYFHFSEESPLRTGGKVPAYMERTEQAESALVGEMQHAAEGKNLELSFRLPDDLWSHASFFLTMYYRAAYEFFPRRVYVGYDDHIIHWAVNLKSANQLPPIDWLHQHDVSAIFWFTAGTQNGPGIGVDRVP